MAFPGNICDRCGGWATELDTIRFCAPCMGEDDWHLAVEHRLPPDERRHTAGTVT